MENDKPFFSWLVNNAPLMSQSSKDTPLNSACKKRLCGNMHPSNAQSVQNVDSKLPWCAEHCEKRQRENVLSKKQISSSSHASNSTLVNSQAMKQAPRSSRDEMRMSEKVQVEKMVLSASAASNSGGTFCGGLAACEPLELSGAALPGPAMPAYARSRTVFHADAGPISMQRIGHRIGLLIGYKYTDDMASIAFLDSGVGGLAYLSAFRERYPHSNLTYVADTAGFPYGRKDAAWIEARVIGLSRAICAHTKCDVLVLSCNTASVIALDAVRAALAEEGSAFPVVGVVPAIKKAVDEKAKRVYVMSTAVTASTGYTKKLIDTFGKDAQFIVRGFPELIDTIERMVLSENFECEDAYRGRAAVLLDAAVEEMRAFNADAVVLGCTHFLHIKSMLEALLAKSAQSTSGLPCAVVDSLEGVVNQIAQQINQQINQQANQKLTLSLNASAQSAQPDVPPRLYVTSARDEEAWGIRAQALGMRFEGTADFLAPFSHVALGATSGAASG